MKAVILAAGQGERLRPLTKNIPKVMLPIGKYPLLEYNIRLLKKYGFDEIAINLFWHGVAIRKYFKDGKKWDVKIHYSEEKEILGTAGGTKKAAKLLELKTNDPLLIYYGDNLTNLNLKEFLSFHQSKKADLTMAVIKREDPLHSGILEFDRKGRIKRFLEKPTTKKLFSHWISGAIYLLNPKILEFIPQKKFFDFGRDFIPKLLELEKRVFAYKLTPEDFLLWVDTEEEYTMVKKIVSKGMVRLQ
ncbi:hypothetical protein A2Z23_01695 [Candidatus Curtissbacteria bacterium RBG_16_39_7]|uniref:Nucleotidyl transferase domain-containing protein n=1 Tax=Candidatus Curtissbacteria bacterium RBG_16_39_7 TaxID=1797707 RepID=A0A1F5G569_9BACT|nr:MAG: hypothetical protein A2Z23_01695 [Candidatus Curtissbacteria bacterium RBG_16_39_7]